PARERCTTDYRCVSDGWSRARLKRSANPCFQAAASQASPGRAGARRSETSWISRCSSPTPRHAHPVRAEVDVIGVDRRPARAREAAKQGIARIGFVQMWIDRLKQ